MNTRFARVVEKASEYGFSGDAFVVSQLEARKLLQREHAAVRRKVKAMPTYDTAATSNGMQQIDGGSYIKVWDLLAWLDERGR